MKRKNIRTIIISRTDALGDVVLTLPMARLIKNFLGDEIRILFFGRTYTYPLIACSDAIDGFINYDNFLGFDHKGQVAFLKECNADAIIHVFPRADVATAARLAGIKTRIGTTNRLFHWFNCNCLVRLGRRNSNLHEAQLNMKLLQPLGHSGNISLEEIPALFRLKKLEDLPNKFSMLLAKDKFRLVIHPKSHSSSRDWKMENYRDLIRFLPQEKFQIIITGSEKEAPYLIEWAKELPSHVLNVAGILSLGELISFLDSCDGIVAASTGPLHIAAALGKNALGIYPPVRPLHPMRWAPLGPKAEFISARKECTDCRFDPNACHCMNDVSPTAVEKRVLQWIR